MAQNITGRSVHCQFESSAGNFWSFRYTDLAGRTKKHHRKHVNNISKASTWTIHRLLVYRSTVFLFVFLLPCSLLLPCGNALGTMTPIAASFSNSDTESTTAAGAASVCAILSGSKQSIACSPSQNSPVLSQISYAGLAGGKGFFCGLRQPSGKPFCWTLATSPRPTRLSRKRFTQIAVGESHLCGIREDGIAECWRNNSHGQATPPPGVVFSQIAAGGSFTCGITASNSNILCWGGNALIQQGYPTTSQFSSLQAGGNHLCGLTGNTTFCWGDDRAGQTQVPQGSRFVSFALGAAHSCGLLESTHEALCWGDNASSQLDVPKGISFTSLAAGDDYTCGISKSNLSVICWGGDFAAAQALPIEAIPGLCVASKCPKATYSFNGTAAAGGAVCGGASQQVCVACKVCPVGFYESAACGLMGDTQCSSSPPAASANHHRHTVMIVVIVLGSTGMFMGLVSLILGLLICCLGHEWCFSSCGRLCGCLKRCKVHHSEQTETHVPSSAIVGSSASRRSRIRSIRSLGHAESFSFSELSLATDGFSDEKKIGAGSFGIVYHGYLSDGREVAIKRGETRPNAKKFQEKEVAFQSEIEFLGRLHHRHLVSLVGFCAEDEERLLVYDYMPNGTLYDHVHEFGSKQQQQQKPSPFQSWQMRTKVALQAAKGIEYLHNYAVPPIIHRDIKSSNILLDANLGS
ncbi:hypothetical protein O6H91_Y063200 [Diphasiastrum complanatum]|nr:hypothetical protein O6H91_Y063200 [Diphasiastrum complanatum]